jgi:hypothetical protein
LKHLGRVGKEKLRRPFSVKEYPNLRTSGWERREYESAISSAIMDNGKKIMPIYEGNITVADVPPLPRDLRIINLSDIAEMSEFIEMLRRY